MNNSRRKLIKNASLGTAGITMAGMGMPAKSYARILGANERVHIGVMGIRKMGFNHVKAYSR